MRQLFSIKRRFAAIVQSPNVISEIVRFIMCRAAVDSEIFLTEYQSVLKRNVFSVEVIRVHFLCRSVLKVYTDI